MPAGNQAFRELSAGRHVMRGPNELTLIEIASNNPSKLVWGGMTSRHVAYYFNSRLALAFAPLALDLFSLSVIRVSRRRRGVPTMALAASTAAFGYFALMYYCRRTVLYGDWWSPMFAAWAPDLAFLGIALLLFLRPRDIGTRELGPASSQRSG
jgi:lipopolysaccharide export LptBFGC system permease protein LptF